MHLFDLGLLPRLLTDQTKGIDDEIAADYERMARQLDALFVAFLPIGMRVICLETIGIVTGWDTAPAGDLRRVPYLSRTVPHAFAAEQAFSPASSTYLPALRAQIIVDASTIPHLCKVIAESFGALNRGWVPQVGESFGIQRRDGTGRAGAPGFRWTVCSTFSGAWDVLSGPSVPVEPEEAVIAVLTARLEEIASAYEGCEPERIGA